MRPETCRSKANTSSTHHITQSFIHPFPGTLPNHFLPRPNRHRIPLPAHPQAVGYSCGYSPLFPLPLLFPSSPPSLTSPLPSSPFFCWLCGVFIIFLGFFGIFSSSLCCVCDTRCLLWDWRSIFASSLSSESSWSILYFLFVCVFGSGFSSEVVVLLCCLFGWYVCEGGEAGSA